MNEQDKFVFLQMCRREFPAAFPAKYEFGSPSQEKFFYQHLIRPDWLFNDFCTIAVGCMDIAHGRNFVSQIVDSFIQICDRPNLNINWINAPAWHWDTHTKLFARTRKEIAVLSELNRQPERLNILTAFDSQFVCAKFIIVKTDDIHDWLVDCFRPVDYMFQVKMKVDKPKERITKQRTIR